MTHVILDFHRVRPISFLSIWYVPCKPCTYVAWRLAISANRPNRDSTWASSPRCTNRCVQNGFLDYGAKGTNYAPIYIKTNTISKRTEARFHMTRYLGVPLGAYNLIFEHMVRSMQTMHLSCIWLALSPNRLNRASFWACSTRSTIECIQNGFLAYGALGANYAPILHRNQHCL